MRSISYVVFAYSSVAHMGLVTLGLFSHTSQGLVAAVAC